MASPAAAMSGAGAAMIAAIVPEAALAQSPIAGDTGLSYVVAMGAKHYPVLTLLRWMTGLMALIVLVILLAVLVGALVRRARADTPRAVPVERRGGGMSFIYVGTALTLPLLIGIALWTYAVLAAVSGPPPHPAFTIEVTGHQWWWEFRYVSDAPDRSFVTADEIHLPVGRPVRLVLRTDDVIHSFWVPALGGKTDTIAGQENTSWIEADQPGVFRGQCTEYCGLQHAHMGLIAVAEPPDQFEAWWRRQLEGPELPDTEAALDRARKGRTAFVQHCAVCHAVRGTEAGGRVGPDLSHLMLRRTIASGSFPNTPGYLSGWIASPQHLKPGNYMPNLALSGPDLTAISSFLTALK